MKRAKVFRELKRLRHGRYSGTRAQRKSEKILTYFLTSLAKIKHNQVAFARTALEMHERAKREGLRYEKTSNDVSPRFKGRKDYMYFKEYERYIRTSNKLSEHYRNQIRFFKEEIIPVIYKYLGPKAKKDPMLEEIIKKKEKIEITVSELIERYKNGMRR